MDSIGTALSVIAFFSIPAGILYYALWIKIEAVAKPLVGAIITISVIYIGYDLFITVFSYGTWAVFFKKFVGSIIIAFPISYFLYWLEQFKTRARISAELNTENLFKNAEFKRLLSLGWSKEIATKRAFGENSPESLANPIKEVGANHLTEDLKWERRIHNAKEPIPKKFSITIELDINKSFAWFINRTLPTKITIILFTLLFLSFLYSELTTDTSYQSYEQEQDY